MFLKDYEGFKHKSIYKRRAKVEVGFKVKLERNQWEMAVRDGRGGDEDGAAIFEEEGVDLTDEEDIALSDIPLHLRPLVSAAESGDLDALRRALGNYYCFIRTTNGILWWFFFLCLPYFPQENTIVRCICWFLEKNRYQYRRSDYLILCEILVEILFFIPFCWLCHISLCCFVLRSFNLPLIWYHVHFSQFNYDNVHKSLCFQFCFLLCSAEIYFIQIQFSFMQNELKWLGFSI